MDAKHATFEMDVYIGALAEEMQKVAFCRDAIQSAIKKKGGSLNLSNLMGLVYIIDEFEERFRMTQEKVQGLFNEAHNNTEAAVEVQHEN